MEVSPRLALFITGQKETQGTVDISGLNFHASFAVKPNQVTTVVIPANAAKMAINQIQQLGIRVRTDDDVTVYGLNQLPRTTDAFLALPVDALGLEYFALSYRGWHYAAQMVVVAAFDNTEVTITPKTAITGHAAGVPFTITLNRGQTYMASATSEITGTHISASAPVAVSTGIAGAQIPVYAAYLDHIASTMPPVSTWGKSFLTVPFATRLRGDFFRILASRDNTQVKVNGIVVATLQRGEFHERVITTRSLIESTEPVLVAQFAAGSSYDQVDADPVQILVTPTAQFLTRYTFSTPETGFDRHYINVVVPTGEVSNLQLDRVPINASSFSVIGNTGFSGGQVSISAGSHNLETTGSVPFGVYVYGAAFHESYGYPGGLSFQAINPIGDRFSPALRLVPFGETLQGSASDSEDANANSLLDVGEDLNGDGKVGRRSEDANGNGKLDAGEDVNGDGVLDRDTGVFKVLLSPDSINLRLETVPFVPGAQAVQFSVTRIDTSRPGTGNVIVEDGAGNKAQQPVGLGLVPTLQGVRVLATLPAKDIEIDQASFQTAPASIKTTNGEVHVEWNFDRFPADIAKDLGFDIIFKNPVPGERRPVVAKLELLYKDVNGNDVRTELGGQAVAVLASIYRVVASTDKPSYGANEAVLVSSLVSNLSAFPANASVRVTLLDAAGVPVYVVGTATVQQIAAGGNLPFGGLVLSTGSLYAGSYRVLAEVLDASGKVAASGNSSFSIVTASGAQATASINVDKREYGPYEQVRVSDRVVNALTNASLDNARVTTQLLNTDGTVRFEKVEALMQLLPSGSKSLAYTVQLSGAAPGTYVARLLVHGANGMLLAQSETQFKVASSSDTGAGLTASLASAASRLHDGQHVKLSFAATNAGNAAFAALPLTLSIVEPATERVIASYPFSADIPIGGTYQGSADWQAVGTQGGSVVAVLSAKVGGKSLAIAQVPLTVLTLSYNTQASARSNVLALVSCKDDAEAANDPACQTTRAQEIARLLTALDVPHSVVLNEADFKRGLRSGSYNTYWLSGKQDKLPGTLPHELREAVFNGDGLLVDGEHDQRNKILDAVVGVRWRGKFGPVDLSVDLGGTIFAAGHVATVGRASRVDLEGGASQAEFNAGVPAGGATAIVSNQYGAGRTLQFAFDLPASSAAHGEWQPLLAKALEYVLLPYDGKLRPGQQVPVSFNVTNAGPQFQAQTNALLPEGAAYVASTGGGVFEGDTRIVSWGFELDTNGEWKRDFTFAAPLAAGSYSVVNTVGTIDPATGDVQLYGAPKSLAFMVGDVVGDASKAIVSLNGMTSLGKQAGRTRDSVVLQLRAAMAACQGKDASSLETAISGLVTAAEDVENLGVGDIHPVHAAISRLLRECQRRWAAAQQ